MNAYREKLLSIQISPTALVTRSKTNYYDREALRATIPEGTMERVADEVGMSPEKVQDLEGAELEAFFNRMNDGADVV